MSGSRIVSGLLLLLALLALSTLPVALARGHANLHRLYERQQEEMSQLRPAVLTPSSGAAIRPAGHLHALQLSLAQQAPHAAQPSFGVDAPSRNVTTEWYTQILDHFEFVKPDATRRTYQQRFYSNMHFYTEGGPAFVYLGGEAELRNSSIDRGFIVELAREHGGALFGLEHRFYGKTQPFPDLASENLVYLTVEQALEDAARFITSMTSERLTPGTQWFVVGGSYPGALSAFMRIKYPSLVAGSLASSAPVHALDSFWQYDAMVSQGAGPACSDEIRKANKAIEAALDASPASAQAVKDLFTCGALPEEENTGFLYVLADAISYAIQYTSATPGSSSYHLKEEVCDRWMLNQTATGLDPVQSFAGFFGVLLGRLNETCTSFSTVRSALTDLSTAPELNQRQWYWQSCLQFGFFQIAPDASQPGQPEPLRSTRIDLQYHLDLCEDVFGWPMAPETEALNARYGGIEPVASRIYFSNGNVDPWSALSLITNRTCCPSLIARMINGTAHCADLHPSDPASDPIDLTATRQALREQVALWLDPRNNNIECPAFVATSDSREAGASGTAPVRTGLRMCNGVCTDTDNDVRHCGGCEPTEDNTVDPADVDDYYCRHGSLQSVGSGSSSSASKQLLIVGIVFLVAGFIALSMGLHAMRKVSVLRQLQKAEAEARERGDSSGYAAPAGRVPVHSPSDASLSANTSGTTQPAAALGGDHGWNREATRPLRSGEGSW